MRKLGGWIRIAIQWVIIVASVGAISHASAADEIRIEIPVLPALVRYTDLLAFPGFFGVALENNGLSPSMSSKLQIKEQGRALEIRNATLKYTGKKGEVYTYEAAVKLNLGVSESRLAFPVIVDTARVSSGKVLVTAMPPLASLFPSELKDRISIKASLVANATTQQKMIEYLDGLVKSMAGNSNGISLLTEAILIDAYNKGGGGAATGQRDVGEAVPLSDQWMLLLTLVIWLVFVPAYLIYHRLRIRQAARRTAA